MQALTLNFFVTLFVVLGVTLADESEKNDVCHSNTKKACDKHPPEGIIDAPCNARYGAIEFVEKDIQSYVNLHIDASFKYLLMATHFANYEKERVGFEKLFRGLSDTAWHSSIALIKYLTKRGSQMDFDMNKHSIKLKDGSSLNEFESLARALDIQKALAKEANRIHMEISKFKEGLHDPEVADYLERHQIHEYSEDIRKLSGYVNDMSKLLKTPDPSLNIYLFDEYLQKAL